mgnify:CR=1 FL=1
MFDNPVYLEPTFTLNGIPISLCGCQASTRKRIAGEGKSIVAVTHLTTVRSQKAGAGILGIHRIRKSSMNVLLFSCFMGRVITRQRAKVLKNT